MIKLTSITAFFAALSLLLTGCQEEDQSRRTPPPPGSAPAAQAAPPAAPVKVTVESVKAALKAADPALATIGVSIDDKAIKLTGTVSDNQMKKKAFETVRAMSGGKQVLPQILTK